MMPWLRGSKDTDDERTRTEIAVTVLPTEAPIVELLTPIAGQYYSDVPITFRRWCPMRRHAEDLLFCDIGCRWRTVLRQQFQRQ